MAVKIRLRRIGKKKAPLYRIIVADARSPRNGRFIEEIGTYDPSKEPSEFHIDEEAAKKWLNVGAQPTDEVGKLLKIAGIQKETGKKAAPEKAPEAAEEAAEAAQDTAEETQEAAEETE